MDKKYKEIHERNRKIKGDSEETEAFAVELNEKIDYDAVNEAGIFVQEIEVNKTMHHYVAQVTYSFAPFQAYSLYNVVLYVINNLNELNECADGVMKDLLEVVYKKRLDEQISGDKWPKKLLKSYEAGHQPATPINKLKPIIKKA